jgi:hypothetical protein
MSRPADRLEAGTIVPAVAAACRGTIPAYRFMAAEVFTERMVAIIHEDFEPRLHRLL